MNKVSCRKALGSASRWAITAAALALPGAGFAQEVGKRPATAGHATAPAAGTDVAAAVNPDQPARSDQIQDIVVTAQFRSQNLQRTPLAITAVTAPMLEARGQSSVEDVANRAPSVTLTTAGGGQGGSQATAINIRGVGQTDFNLALEPGVGLYIDDVYYGTAYGSLFDLLDLDRVEILRGPQGTLSGKNSEGGALKLYAKQPSAEGGGYIEADYGSYNLRMLRAGANFTLVPDKLFVRLTGLAEKQDGFLTRYDYQCKTGQPADQLGYIGSQVQGGTNGCKIGTEGSKDVVALRAAVRYTPTSSISDTLVYDTTIDRSGPPPGVLVYQGTWHGPNFSLIGPPGPNPVGNFVPPAGSYYNFATYCGLVGTKNQYCADPIDRLDAWGIANTLNIDLPAGIKIKSITAYRKLDQSGVDDIDTSPLSRNQQVWNVDYKQFTQELRLSGKALRIIDWTVGGFYFHAKARQGGRINIDGAGDNLIPFAVTTDFLFNDPVHIESKSGFAHVEVTPIEKLTVTGGVRYTSDYKNYSFVRYFAPGYTPGPIDASIAGTNGLSGTYRASRWDYRVTAAYQVAPTVNVYGQVATGFKGGGVNPRPYYAQQVRAFSPESVTAYEAGVKSDLFDRHVRLNIAAFYNKYKNMQLTLQSCPQYVPVGAPQNCLLPANVGDSTIKGAEVEAEVHLGHLSLDGSMSYVDFHYDSVDPATGIRLTDRPPFSPKWKVAAGAQYELQWDGFGTITPRVDYQYQSVTNSEAINYPNGRIPGYGLFNFRLAYRTEDKGWEVALIVSNLTDKYYYLSRFDQSPPANTPPSYNLATVQPGAPREFRVMVKKLF